MEWWCRFGTGMVVVVGGGGGRFGIGVVIVAAPLQVVVPVVVGVTGGPLGREPQRRGCSSVVMLLVSGGDWGAVVVAGGGVIQELAPCDKRELQELPSAFSMNSMHCHPGIGISGTRYKEQRSEWSSDVEKLIWNSNAWPALQPATCAFTACLHATARKVSEPT